jgi:hypothetical protein
LITANGHIEIADTEYSIRTALSIVENGTLLIRPPDITAVQNFPKIENLDKIYSPYGIGLSLIFIPFLITSKLLAWLTGIELRLILDFILSFYNIPFAILGLYFFQNITLQLGASTKKSIFMTIVLGVGTCFWKYSVTDFSEISQSCLILGIIYTILKRKKNIWQNLSFYYSCLLLIKLTYFIYLPCLLVYFFSENMRGNGREIRNNLFKASVYFVPTCSFIALINFLRFNNVFESGYGNVIKFSLDFFTRDWFGNIFSYERGILTFNPILIISLAGIFLTPIKYRKPIIIICLTALIWYATMCFWQSWQGGYCWGNRLLTPIVPLLLIPLVFLKFNRMLSKILLALTLVGSMIIQFAASFTKIHEIIEIKLSIQKLTEQVPHSQLWRGIELFFHKLKSPNAEYLTSTFGADHMELINLKSFDTFHGFNLWFVHLLNHFDLKTYSHFSGILILLVTIGLCIALLRIHKINIQT